MTRKEAIEELKILKEDYWDDDGYGHETKQYDDTMLALDMAIKALEQEPILDKIYADIQRLRGCSCSCSDGIIDGVEDILDKYKAGSER